MEARNSTTTSTRSVGLVVALFLLVPVWLCVCTNSVQAGTLTFQSTLGGPKLTVQVDSPSELQYRGVVRAAADSSCASSSLATVFTHYLRVPMSEEEALSDLLALRGGSSAGAAVSFSLLDMKNVAENRGYGAYGIRGTVALIREQSLIPSIVLLQTARNAHFTVLKSVSDEEVFLADPIFGNIALTVTDFEGLWNGILLAFDQAGAGGEVDNRPEEGLLDIGPPRIPTYSSVNRILATGFLDDMSESDEF